MQFDDLLLIDGDCIFSNILIEKMLFSKNNLILTKNSFKKMRLEIELLQIKTIELMT